VLEKVWGGKIFSRWRLRLIVGSKPNSLFFNN